MPSCVQAERLLQACVQTATPLPRLPSRAIAPRLIPVSMGLTHSFKPAISHGRKDGRDGDRVMHVWTST